MDREAFVARIRAATGWKVPEFDPGGPSFEAARVLLLLEAPGRRARDGGVVTLDDVNPTARHLRALVAESGLDRRTALLWNAVPWYVGEPGRGGPVRAADRRDAAPWLAELFFRLPRLRSVVALGRTAGEMARGAPVPVIETWHPSGQNLFPRTTGPAKRAHLRDALAQAALTGGSRSVTGTSRSVSGTGTESPSS